MRKENSMEDVQEKQEEKLSEQDRRKFAQEQYDFLKQKGLGNRMRLSRIFKAAGPGQVKDAYELATCENWETEEGQARKDLLDCILAGSTCVNFGWKRMETVLSLAKFPIPQAHNAKCFFRILAGASEILVPGSYEFTDVEMREIKDGLKKRVHEEGDEDESGSR